jgi:hypothetical protein
MATPTDRRADNPDLHAVLDEIEAAHRYLTASAPLPPTALDLALALNRLAHAVTVLACRTLGRDDTARGEEHNA